MKKTLSLALLGVLSLAGGNALAAGDAAAGKAKAAMCVSCHGATGVSAVDMYPNLAGQKAAYLVKALKAYKSGDRNDPTMKGMVGALSDADIENVAAFFASQSCK